MSQLPFFAGLTDLKERLPLSIRLMRWITWLGITIIISGLGVFARYGTLIRYLADDYCFSSVLNTQGFFEAQVFWYMTTSSRITVMLIVGISELFGSGAIQWLPMLVIFLGSASLYLTLRGLAGFLPIRIEREYILLTALLIVFFAILVAPNRLQSLYWRAGTLTYTFPMVLGLLGIAIGVYYLRWSKKYGMAEWGPVLGFLIAFFAGACSETYAAVQTGFLILAGIGSVLLLKHKDRLLTIVLTGAALLGSLLSMIVMILSPANHSRMAIMPPTPSLLLLIEMSVIFAWDYIRDSMSGQVLANLALFTLSTGVGIMIAYSLNIRNPEIAKQISIDWEKLLVGVAAIPLVCYLLVVCGMAPSVFGESSPPEARALMISRSVLVAGTAAWGIYMGYSIYWLAGRWRDKIMAPESRKIVLLILFGLLWLYPLRAAWLTLDEIPQQAAWTAAWDARDQIIRSAAQTGVKEITVPALDSRQGVMELGESNLWVNRCAASYYGIYMITAEE